MPEQELAATRFAEAVAIMARLRAPTGCAWDREQTPDTIRKHTLEETYEVLDAIDRRDWPNLCEELGDMLLQVLFYAQMASEEHHFSIEDVLEGLNRKLIRRHPHVFGAEASAAAGNRAIGLALDEEDATMDAAVVIRNWSAIKAFEKKHKALPEGLLSDVPRSQPALLEAAKLGSAAAKVGFDWPDAQGLLEKLREEAAEVEAELATAATPKAALAEEVGDLLFTAANLARHLKLDPETTLRDASAKFRRRFAAMEAAGAANHLSLEMLDAATLEELWAQVKAQETK